MLNYSNNTEKNKPESKNPLKFQHVVGEPFFVAQLRFIPTHGRTQNHFIIQAMFS